MKEEVNNPEHYNKSFVEAIDIIGLVVDNDAFCMGNFIKYIIRAPYKGNFKKDIQKASWYLENIKNNIYLRGFSSFENSMIIKFIKNLNKTTIEEKKCAEMLAKILLSYDNNTIIYEGEMIISEIQEKFVQIFGDYIFDETEKL